MRALAYDAHGGPEVLRVREMERPPLRAGDVLIRVRAATVAPGDCKLRAGLLAQFFSVRFPKIPGRYGAGEVVAVGADVDYARPGDRVVFGTDHGENGSCAEYVVRGRERVARAPAGMGDAEAVAVVHEGVNAFNCAKAGRIAPGTQILVHGGAGAVGGACVQLANHLGAIVTATCRSCDDDYVRALGARHVVAFDREDFAQVVANEDVVIDTQGGDVHARSYRVLRRGGRLVYLNAAPIKDQGAEHGVEVVNASASDTHAVLDAVARLVEQGAMRPRVGKIFPLSAAAEAHRLVESGAMKRGRVVLALGEGAPSRAPN